MMFRAVIGMDTNKEQRDTDRFAALAAISF